MAVPQYPPPVVGGLERQAHELSKSLLKAGVRVSAISGQTVENNQNIEQLEGVTIYRLPWPNKKWVRFLRTPFDIFLTLFSTRNDFDVIHIHQQSWFGLFCIISGKLLNKPTLIKLPNVGDFGIPAMQKGATGFLKIIILKMADSIVAMSKESIRELEMIDYPYERILATPNGISIGNLDPSHQGNDNQSSGDLCKVVFVGRLREEKQLVLLIRCWHKIYKEVENKAVLEIWGEGPQEKELKAIVDELGLSHTIKFRGHVSNVRSQLMNADIFVLPSRAEGNSNAILEAMAAGIPILSTKVGGTPMLVGKIGENYLFNIGDKTNLQKKLLYLINNPQERDSIGTSMRERVEKYLDIELVAQTYADAYSALANRDRNLIYQFNNSIIISN